MKKGLIFIMAAMMIFFVLVLSGCSKKVESVDGEVASEAGNTLVDIQATENTSEPESVPSGEAVDPVAFMGYWWQVEIEDNGTVKDLKDNPVYYLEITENRMYFNTMPLIEDEGYSVAEKYYVLDGAYCYYDYDEITQGNYKNAIDSDWGGRFVVTFDEEDRLVLTEYYNHENKDDGYSIATYVKIPATEWPIKE